MGYDEFSRGRLEDDGEELEQLQARSSESEKREGATDKDTTTEKKEGVRLRTYASKAAHVSFVFLFLCLPVSFMFARTFSKQVGTRVSK